MATIDKGAAPHYFSGGNTASGFVSYYDYIFGDLERLYIIKGAPGTGKSKLMRDIANEAHNRNYKVEYYHCASDPDSLDGVIIRDLSVGVLDGTAPHVRDTVYPGVCDEIVNLGDFWNASKLRESGDEIKQIINEKGNHYTRAYAYQHAAEELESELQRIYCEAVLNEKMSAASARVLSSCCHGNSGKSGGKLIIRPLEAFSAGGLKTFDTYARQAEKRYFLRDERGIGYLFLRNIIDGGAAAGETVEFSYDAYSGKRERAVYLTNCKTAFVPYDEKLYDEGAGDKIINMERFVDSASLKQFKSGIRFAKKYRDLLLEGAVGEFDINKTLHAHLENIYGKAMDFSRKEEFTKRLLMKIFS